MDQILPQPSRYQAAHVKIRRYGGSLPTRCDILSCIQNFETRTEVILGKEDYRKKES